MTGVHKGDILGNGPPRLVTAFSGGLVNSGINSHENTNARRRMDGLLRAFVSSWPSVREVMRGLGAMSGGRSWM
jgi:hypothetical protein